MALLEFIPLIAFFAVYKFFDIYWATAVLMAASALHIAVVYLRNRTVPKNQVAILAIGLVLGGLTLLLQDKRFIMLKPTALYAIFALVIVVSQWFKKPIVKTILGSAITMSDKLWAKVSYIWAVFFTAAAILNVYIANTLSEEQWVNFKVFGMTAASFILIIGTVLSLNKYLNTEEDK